MTGISVAEWLDSSTAASSEEPARWLQVSVPIRRPWVSRPPEHLVGSEYWLRCRFLNSPRQNLEPRSELAPPPTLPALPSHEK